MEELSPADSYYPAKTTPYPTLQRNKQKNKKPITRPITVMQYTHIKQLMHDFPQDSNLE